jgi:hypothetical protein
MRIRGFETWGSFFGARSDEACGAQERRSPRYQNAFCGTPGKVRLKSDVLGFRGRRGAMKAKRGESSSRTQTMRDGAEVSLRRPNEPRRVWIGAKARGLRSFRPDRSRAFRMTNQRAWRGSRRRSVRGARTALAARPKRVLPHAGGGDAPTALGPDSGRPSVPSAYTLG